MSRPIGSLKSHCINGHELNIVGRIKESQCKACIPIRAKRWKLATPEKQYRYKIKNRYGLSSEALDRLILNSNGQCQICSENFKNAGRDFNIDHDHNTGRVRGLLCMRCNHLLAGVEDKVFCVKASLYLNGN